MTALRWWGNYLVNLGVVEDETLDAITAGPADETVSLRTAKAAAAGNKFACFFCGVLSVLVQTDHCAKQLANQPMTAWNYARAAFFISIALAAPIYLAVRFL